MWLQIAIKNVSQTSIENHLKFLRLISLLWNFGFTWIERDINFTQRTNMCDMHFNHNEIRMQTNRLFIWIITVDEKSMVHCGKQPELANRSRITFQRDNWKHTHTSLFTIHYSLLYYHIHIYKTNVMMHYNITIYFQVYQNSLNLINID